MSDPINCMTQSVEALLVCSIAAILLWLIAFYLYDAGRTKLGDYAAAFAIMSICTPVIVLLKSLL